MEQVLQDMIIALRSSGVRISVSESMDAMHAARLMGYGDRQILKDSLSAALAKTQRDIGPLEDCVAEAKAYLDGLRGPGEEAGLEA